MFPGRILGARFFHDGSKVVTATLASGLKVWDSKTGKQLGPWQRQFTHGYGRNAVFSPDGRHLLTNSLWLYRYVAREGEAGQVLLWEIDEKDLLPAADDIFQAVGVFDDEPGFDHAGQVDFSEVGHRVACGLVLMSWT